MLVVMEHKDVCLSGVVSPVFEGISWVRLYWIFVRGLGLGFHISFRVSGSYLFHSESLSGKVSVNALA